MKTRILFEELEPLMFRGPGELDPSARGVATLAQSTGWPSIGTITGTIVSEVMSMRGIHPPNPASEWEKFVDNYKNLLDRLSIEWIRGPYLCDESQYVRVPILLGGKALHYTFPQIIAKIITEFINKEINVWEVIKRITDYSELPINVQKIGTALTSRDKGIKNVREGYLYTETFVSLKHHAIALEVGSSSDDILKDLNEKPVKLGGENRFVKSKLDGELPLASSLEKFNEGYVVLLSPFLMLETPETVVKNDGILELRYRDMQVEIIMGRIDIKGLGFAVNETKRKPILPAILEGSILKVKNCSDTLRLGLYGCLHDNLAQEESLFGRIGFGSFYVLRVQP